jgi:hypothetical protein
VADGVRVEYLSARFPDLANSEGIKAKATDEVLRAIYEAGKESKYRSPATPGSDTPSYIPFEKVKDEISFAFRDGEAVKLADERIRQAQEKLQRSASPAAVDLEALAKELGLRYGLTDYILKDGVKNAEATLKDLQGVTEMPGIAFGMKDGAVLADDRLKVMNGRALIRRKDLRPSFIRDFADVRGEVQTRVAARKATDLAAQHARQVREKALAGFAEGADAQARSKTFESVVQEMPYVGDSQFSPAARNTEYFMRPFLMGRGGPGQYWAYVPGLNRPGVNFPNFAFEAFELPRGRISAPVAEPQDETECYLLIISGTTQPTEEEYKKQKEQLAAGYLRQKQTAAVQGVSAALERLTDPPR